MNRRAVFILSIWACLIIVSIWLFPKSVWRVISQDGASGGGFGPGRRGHSFGTQKWKAWGGGIIDEDVITYSSIEDARKDFEEAMKSPGTIMERKKYNGYFSDIDERAVKVFGKPGTKEGAAQIIKLQGRQIHYVDAASLKYALMFEESWFKLCL